MREKTRVVCDTMIWYYIAEGNIIPEIDVDLVATGVSIQEFASSENIYKKPELVKNALKAMQNYHFEIIEFDPWDYIITFCVDISYEPISRELHKNNLNGFSHFINGTFDEALKSIEQREKLENFILNWNEPLVELTNNMNFAIDKIRKERAKKFNKRENIKDLEDGGLLLEIKEMILDIISARLNISKDEIGEKFNWEKIELLVKMWELHWIQILRQNGAKIHLNDIFDLLNMAYVSEKDKYWTLEKSWLVLMKSNSVTAKYVYEIP